jgi:glycosyltransferase involved in cell wall biosynthesis
MAIHLIGVTNPNHSRTLQLVRCIQARGTLRVTGWGSKNLGIQGLGSLSSILKLPFEVLFGLRKIYSAILKADRDDTLVLSHPAQLNFIVSWPLLKVFRKKHLVDFYVSLYDTLVSDRKIISPKSPLAWGLRKADQITLRYAGGVIFDSQSNARRFGNLVKRGVGNIHIIYPRPPELFFREESKTKVKTDDVIFVGQFSPLQGLETIAKALQDPRLLSYSFTLIGSGPEREERHLEGLASNVTRISRVDYEELAQIISKHRISLGVFGTSEKAQSVFPNKVAESLALGVPVITAAGEVSKNFRNIGCLTIPPGEPTTLADEIIRCLEDNKFLQSLVRATANYPDAVSDCGSLDFRSPNGD